MKIIDRYVLGSFIRNYLISFMVLIGMYVALDMVFNFANLTQSRSLGSAKLSFAHVMANIATFYFYKSFAFFAQLSGMIAVVAAGFTVMRLSRFNELTALLAAGVPLLRVVISVIVAGVILNLILLPIDQELIIPRIIPQVSRDHQDVNESTGKTYSVQMMMGNSNKRFNASRYTPPTETAPATIEYLDVIELDPDLNPAVLISATRAAWNSQQKQWDLTDGQRALLSTPEHPQYPVVSELDAYVSDITPEEIAINRGKDYIELLPASKISQLLARSGYGTLQLLRTKHLRFTQPLTNVILLLLAISTVLTRDPGSLKTSALRCMLLTGVCMGSIFLAYQMSGRPPSRQWFAIWPALMAWLPIFIFGPLSVYLLQKVKT